MFCNSEIGGLLFIAESTFYGEITIDNTSIHNFTKFEAVKVNGYIDISRSKYNFGLSLSGGEAGRGIKFNCTTLNDLVNISNIKVLTGIDIFNALFKDPFYQERACRKTKNL